MKILILAVGSRMPGWVEAGVDDYRERLPRDFQLAIQEIPLAHRAKGYNPKLCADKEASVLLAHVRQQDHVVAMEVAGKQFDTAGLAARLDRLRQQADRLVLVLGGPDGLGGPLRERADEAWSLSPLTLPHGLARIVLAEQLYRAWSLLNNHPYHRD